jgi:hypothetical protein
MEEKQIINPLIKTPPRQKRERVSPELQILAHTIPADSLANKFMQVVDDKGNVSFKNLLTGETVSYSDIQKNKDANIITPEKDIVQNLSDSAIKRKKNAEEEQKKQQEEAANALSEQKKAEAERERRQQELMTEQQKAELKEKKETKERLKYIIIASAIFILLIIILLILKYYVYDNTGCENLKLIDQSNIDSLKNKILTNTNNDKNVILNSFNDVRKSEEKIKNDIKLKDEDKTFLRNDLTSILKDNVFDPAQTEYNLLLKEIENTQKLLLDIENANNEKNNNIKAYYQLQDKVKYYGLICE